MERSEPMIRWRVIKWDFSLQYISISSRGMEFTIIVLGRLEYANSRSVQQATKVITHLLETRYKNEVLYRDVENLLDDELCALIAPREKFQCSEKVWMNTIHMLAKASEFSIAGDLHLWKVFDGTLQEHVCLEPDSDKSTVQSFRRGRQLIDDGKLEEAKKLLTKAVDRFPRHAQALERRGFIHYTQGDTEAAISDYAASIEVDSKRPDAYLGRARILIKQEEWTLAMEDLTLSMKHSMPHHNVYLEALHRKAKCLLELGQYDKAIPLFNFFLSRPLQEDHPQYVFRRQVAFDKGRTLAAAGKLEDAINMFDEALKMPANDGKPETGEILLHRGLAFQQSGQSGFIEDWKKAADEGSERAAELLAEVV